MKNAISMNVDIHSDTAIFEKSFDKIRVKDTDTGEKLMGKISDLTELLKCYELGSVKERFR